MNKKQFERRLKTIQKKNAELLDFCIEYFGPEAHITNVIDSVQCEIENAQGDLPYTYWEDYDKNSTH